MNRPEGLSGREYKALNFMHRHLKEWDAMPTNADITAELDLSSTAIAFNIINALCEKGFIEKYAGGRYRFSRD